MIVILMILLWERRALFSSPFYEKELITRLMAIRAAFACCNHYHPDQQATASSSSSLHLPLAHHHHGRHDHHPPSIFLLLIIIIFLLHIIIMAIMSGRGGMAIPEAFLCGHHQRQNYTHNLLHCIGATVKVKWLVKILGLLLNAMMDFVCKPSVEIVLRSTIK